MKGAKECSLAPRARRRHTSNIEEFFSVPLRNDSDTDESRLESHFKAKAIRVLAR